MRRKSPTDRRLRSIEIQPHRERPSASYPYVSAKFLKRLSASGHKSRKHDDAGILPVVPGAIVDLLATFFECSWIVEPIPVGHVPINVDAALFCMITDPEGRPQLLDGPPRLAGPYGTSGRRRVVHSCIQLLPCLLLRLVGCVVQKRMNAESRAISLVALYSLIPVWGLADREGDPALGCERHQRAEVWPDSTGTLSLSGSLASSICSSVADSSGSSVGSLSRSMLISSAAARRSRNPSRAG